MNPIGTVLDLIVLAFLVWALALGLKLNKRLKGLRDGQEGFAKAVGELNEAARRAEAGLADIRRTAEETHDALQSRIETARGLIARLEAASEDLSASRASSVTRLAADNSSLNGGARGNASSSPAPQSRREVGEVDWRAQRDRTEGARAGPANPAPAGFAEMIRRTLKDSR